MKIDILIGLQWGDEGKGKIVDVLSPNYNVIARFQGGPNAGHTIEFSGIKHVLHTIPSGIFHKKVINIIGNGVVIDPAIFSEEIEALAKIGVKTVKNLYISKRSHLITPSHRILDAASEAAKGKSKIGTTLKGISPAYMDKTGRNGLRVGDIFSNSFKEKYHSLVSKHKQILRQYNYVGELVSYEKKWFDGVNLLRSLQIEDTEHLINNFIKLKHTILAEGAQGTMLDMDFGTYPYVTSSNTISAAACTGLGVSPHTIGNIFGIAKAYSTRVGSGPFPTEQDNSIGEELRNYGHEYGSTTGRPRRCGWLDLPALKYAIMLNGVNKLIITKLDVLSNFEKIKVATAYKINGQVIDYFPYEVYGKIEPVYEEFKGWQKDLSGINSYKKLPKQVLKYIEFIEKKVEVPIKIISVGPDRGQTIFK